MVTREDLESYLIRMDLEFEEVDEGMFLVQPRSDGPPVVVHHSPPLLLVRLKVMEVPEGRDLRDLFKALLTWNATDVVHGAYGLDEEDLVITDTLELESLDFPELQASLESMQMASASHMNEIKTLAGAGEEG